LSELERFTEVGEQGFSQRSVFRDQARFVWWPIGMALFSRAAPPAITGLMIGVYFLSVFAGSLLVGWVGQFYEAMSAPAFWLLHAGAAGAAGLIILVLWGPLSAALAPRPA